MNRPLLFPRTHAYGYGTPRRYGNEGMPREAIELGAVDHVLPLKHIPGMLLALVRPA